MFEQAFRNIDDILRKEAGCTTELDYTEQTSWLLFLKYLDGLEQDRAAEAKLDGKKYTYILDKDFRWEGWAAPKDKAGKIDHNNALSGDDLRDFVKTSSFPTCRASSSGPARRTLSNTRSARSSGRSRIRSRAATTCAKSSITSTSCASARRPRSTSSRTSTKPKSGTWATPGATAASTTRRAR